MAKKFVTAGTIAERTGISLPNVLYLLRARNIQPEGRAGRLRVFSEETVQQVKDEHEQIHRRR